MHFLQLLLHAVAPEQRGFQVGISLNPLRVARNEELHEFLGDPVLLLALDNDFLDIPPVEIANRPLDQAGFLVNERRRHGVEGIVADTAPQTEQIFVVALDLGLAAPGSGRPHDDRHALGDLQLGKDGLEPAPVRSSGDLAGNTAPSDGIGHQNPVSAREGQIGRQGRALVAPLLLDHLDQQNLPPLDDLLDFVAPRRRPGPAPRDFLVVVIGVVRFGEFAVFAGENRRFVLPFLDHVFREQRLAVRDRDLIVIGMNFVECQEPVPVAAVIDEGGLKRGFDPGNFR